ncbi:MAG: F0F1 ATP synthase subunit B [bacterium]
METLGLNIHNIIVQIFGFIIVFLILRKFLFFPLRAVAESRQREIMAQLSALEREKAEIEELKKDLDARLQGIYEERREILQKERERARQMAQEILESARAEAQKIREKARRDMDLEREKMLISMREMIADLVIVAMEKALRSTLDEAKQRELLAKLLEEIEIESSKEIRRGIS